MDLGRFGRTLTLALVVGLAAPALGADQAGKAPEPGGILDLLPEASTTRHSLALSGRMLDYEAEAGTIRLREASGTVTAAVFHVAYTVKGPTAGRPVTFVFNGGPGAASAYLHLGALGPKVIETAPDGGFLPPPPKLRDNPDSWLAFTDLVFVDPPGTGYSRAASADMEERFYGVDQDATAMAAFVRLWLQKADRTEAPVYLAGESYGAFRAALLAARLQEEVGIAPSGLVLISPALEFSRLYGDGLDPIAPALTLPAFAAVHLERQGIRGRQALAERLAEVEAYALGPYLGAMAKGLESGGAKTAETVARFTGLDPDLVARRHGRVSTSLFIKEYDRKGGTVLSRYDGTIGGPDPDPDDPDPTAPDAVLDRSVPALTAAMVDHTRETLGYRTDVTYRLLNRDVSRRWDYGTSPSRQGYAGVLDDLQEARALNPSLEVLIAHGYTDLVTPYFTTRFLLSQLPTLAEAEPIRMETYEGGHMMYLRPDSRRALAEDAADLYGAGETGAARNAGPAPL